MLLYNVTDDLSCHFVSAYQSFSMQLTLQFFATLLRRKAALFNSASTPKILFPTLLRGAMQSDCRDSRKSPFFAT